MDDYFLGKYRKIDKHLSDSLATMKHAWDMIKFPIIMITCLKYANTTLNVIKLLPLWLICTLEPKKMKKIIPPKSIQNNSINLSNFRILLLKSC